MNQEYSNVIFGRNKMNLFSNKSYFNKLCCKKVLLPIGPKGPRGQQGPMGSLSQQGTCYADYLFWNNQTTNFEVGSENVNLGCGSGEFNTSQNFVAIGYQSGYQGSDGEQSVSIGYQSGYQNQSNYSVAIGYQSGMSNQSSQSIAIGLEAGNVKQGVDSIAIGSFSGNVNQSENAVAIGCAAGEIDQSQNAIAIGENAGSNSQSRNAIAIGTQAGSYEQGQNSIAIGAYAGASDPIVSQDDYTIILNATGNSLNSTDPSSTYIAPIRNILNENYLLYNSGTKEVTYFNESIQPFQGLKAYGSFYDISDISLNSIPYIVPMQYNQTDISYGVYIDKDGSGNPSLIKFLKNGIFNVQFSAQIETSGGGGANQIVFIWLRKNYVDVANTNTRVDLKSSNNWNVAAWNFFVVVNNYQTDFYQIVAGGNAYNTNNILLSTIPFGDTQNRLGPGGEYNCPVVPSIILTVNQIN